MSAATERDLYNTTRIRIASTDDRRCEKCWCRIPHASDTYWIINNTRQQIYVYCEDCARVYLKGIRVNGGTVEEKAEFCRDCGHQLYPDIR